MPRVPSSRHFEIGKRTLRESRDSSLTTIEGESPESDKIEVQERFLIPKQAIMGTPCEAGLVDLSLGSF